MIFLKAFLSFYKQKYVVIFMPMLKCLNVLKVFCFVVSNFVALLLVYLNTRPFQMDCVK